MNATDTLMEAADALGSRVFFDEGGAIRVRNKHVPPCGYRTPDSFALALVRKCREAGLELQVVEMRTGWTQSDAKYQEVIVTVSEEERDESH